MFSAAKGAYSPEQTYTVDDVNELTKYANARGIDVMLEVDNPVGLRHRMTTSTDISLGAHK